MLVIIFCDFELLNFDLVRRFWKLGNLLNFSSCLFLDKKNEPE